MNLEGGLFCGPGPSTTAWHHPILPRTVGPPRCCPHPHAQSPAADGLASWNWTLALNLLVRACEKFGAGPEAVDSRREGRRSPSKAAAPILIGVLCRFHSSISFEVTTSREKSRNEHRRFSLYHQRQHQLHQAWDNRPLRRQTPLST